ncbi:MAG: response regulator transcription factor [Anaerolineaceae bacterium]|nr:response regulator transcription factor [Anaerolineaceae bacterium]
MTIRVIAVDDHHLILRALSDLLNEYSDIQLVATSNHGSQLLNLVKDHNPDIAIVDLGMSGDSFNPISSVRTLHEQFPNVKILVLTGYDDGLWVRELVKAGASGYMLKSDDFSLNIPQAIRALCMGRKFFSPGVADKFVEYDIDKLTPRELSVLHLLSQGLATDIIASNLGVTEKRVRNVLVIICDKLAVDKAEGFSPRVAAINKARELGLIPRH